MRKLLLSSLLFVFAVTAFAQPKQIKSFDNLMDALNRGEQVRCIIHYGNVH